MKKILVVGASSVESIGTKIGEVLEGDGHEVTFASRTAALGDLMCNLTEESLVRRALMGFRPHVIIHAAGVYTVSGGIGTVEKFDLKSVRQNIAAKAQGAFVLANLAAKIGCVEKMVFLEGRTLSSDKHMTADCMANAALLALVNMGNAHEHGTRYYYLDLPLVRDSPMGVRFLKENPRVNPAGAIMRADVAQVVQRIVNGNEPHRHVLLGKEWTI